MERGGSASQAIEASSSEARILFVTQLSGADVPDDHSFGPDIEVVDFADVTADLLERFAPDFIVSPIVTQGFDIVDLGVLLVELKYSGAYRVLTGSPLPNPGLVLREVRNQCPGLDIDIVSMDMLRG